MKTLIYLILFSLISTIIRAEPYLVYAPTVTVKAYQIELDGQDPITIEPTNLNDGTFRLVWDLVNLEPGAHKIRARAEFELWGWIPWSEEFHVVKPSALTDPQIITNP